MKKSIFIKSAYLSILIGLSSCTNFLNGSSLVEELDDCIEYQNSSSLEVYISASEGTGSFVSGNGKQNLKVGDTCSIEFTPNSSYQFIKWIAIDKNEWDNNQKTVSLDNYINFSEKTNAKTTIKLLAKKENILIMPQCKIRPCILKDEIIPSYDKAGVAYNNILKIPVNNYLKDTLEDSNINVKFECSSIPSVGDYFIEPKIVGGKYLCTQINPEKYNNFLSLFSSVAAITIKIEKGWIDEDDVACNNDSSVIFAVNKSYITNDTPVSVSFSVNENEGSLSLSGEQQLYLGHEYQLSCKIADGLYFDHWGIFYKGEKSEIKNARSIIQFNRVDERDTLDATFKVLFDLPDLEIRPVCYVMPKITNFSPEYNANGVEKNSTIKITFDSAIDESSFYYTDEELKDIPAGGISLSTNNGDVYGYKLGDGTVVWKNIKITNDDNANLLSYFTNPQFEKNNLFCIYALDNIGSNQTINVSVNKQFTKSIVDLSGKTIHIPGSNAKSFYEAAYFVNDKTQTHNPQFISLELASLKENIIGKKSDYFYTEGDGLWNSKNRTSSKFFINAEIFDQGVELENDVTKLIVSQQRLFNPEGGKENDCVYEKVYDIEYKNNDKFHVSKALFEYDFQYDKRGIYKITLKLQNQDGTYSEETKTYLVCYADTKNVGKINVYNENIALETGSEYSVSKINEKVSTIYVGLENDYSSYTYQIYNDKNYNISTTPDYLSLFIQYDGTKKLNCTSGYRTANNCYQFNVKAPEDFFAREHEFTVCFIDDYGITINCSRTIPCFVYSGYCQMGDKLIQYETQTSVPQTETSKKYNMLSYEYLSSYSDDTCCCDATETDYENLIIQVSDAGKKYVSAIQKYYEDEKGCRLYSFVSVQKDEKYASDGWNVFDPIVTVSTDLNPNAYYRYYQGFLATFDYASSGKHFGAPEKNSGIIQAYVAVSAYRHSSRSREFSGYDFGDYKMYYVSKKGKELLDTIYRCSSGSGGGTVIYVEEVLVTKEDKPLSINLNELLEENKLTFSIEYKDMVVVKTVDILGDVQDVIPPKITLRGNFDKYTDASCNYRRAECSIEDDNFWGTEMQQTKDVDVYFTKEEINDYDELKNCRKIKAWVERYNSDQYLHVCVKDSDCYKYGYLVVTDESSIHNYAVFPLGKLKNIGIYDIDQRPKNRITKIEVATRKEIGSYLFNGKAGDNFINEIYENRIITGFKRPECYFIRQIDNGWNYCSQWGYGDYSNFTLPSDDVCPCFVRLTHNYGLHRIFYMKNNSTRTIDFENTFNPECNCFILTNSNGFLVYRDADEAKPCLVQIYYSAVNWSEKEIPNTDLTANERWTNFASEYDTKVITSTKSFAIENIPSDMYWTVIVRESGGYELMSDVQYKK